MSSEFDIPTNFPAHVAEAVLLKLQSRYGTEFDKKYPVNGRHPNIYLADMIQMAREVLDGLTPNDIKNGLAKLNREEWCPNLPRFRSLCEQGGSWLTQNEAWVQVLNHLASPGKPITVQAHKAMQQVSHILNQEGQKAASYAFKDVYQRIVDECKANGERQTNYQPVLIEAPVAEQKEAVPMPAHIRQQLEGMMGKFKGLSQ